MDKTTIEEVIAFLKQALVKNNIHIDSIALFGSALNGNMSADSDIDMIIISSDFADIDIFKRADMTMKAELETMKKFKIPMDIINLSPEEFEVSNYKLYYKAKIIA